MKIFRILLPKDTIAFQDQTALLDNLLGKENITDINPDIIGNSNADIDNTWHQRNYGFPLSRTEADIMRMHLYAWQLFRDSNEPWVMILDNSVILEQCPDLPQLKQELDSSDWELCFPYEQETLLNARDQLRDQTILNANSREETEYESYLFGKKWVSSLYFLSRKGVQAFCSLNTIKRNIEDELIYTSMLEKLNMFCMDIPWFRLSAQQNVTIRDREHEIYQAIVKNSTWTEVSIASIRKLLSIISEVANREQIDLILQGGTHLAYIRHGGMIPWDDDVDLGVRQENLDKLLCALDTVEGVGWARFVEGHSNTPYYKIWLREQPNITHHDYSFPFVDLWVYHVTGHDLVFLNGIICPGSAKRDFPEIEFEGAKFKIPYNSIECLNTRYKDWQTTIRVYSWRHSQEDAGFHRLKTRIEVDENGRMIKYVFAR